MCWDNLIGKHISHADPGPAKMTRQWDPAPGFVVSWDTLKILKLNEAEKLKPKNSSFGQCQNGFPSLSYLSWGTRLDCTSPKPRTGPTWYFLYHPRNPRLWLLIILGSRIGGNGYRVIHANCRALYTRFDVDWFSLQISWPAPRIFTLFGPKIRWKMEE